MFLLEIDILRRRHCIDGIQINTIITIQRILCFMAELISPISLSLAIQFTECFNQFLSNRHKAILGNMGIHPLDIDFFHGIPPSFLF